MSFFSGGRNTHISLFGHSNTLFRFLRRELLMHLAQVEISMLVLCGFSWRSWFGDGGSWCSWPLLSICFQPHILLLLTTYLSLLVRLGLLERLAYISSAVFSMCAMCQFPPFYFLFSINVLKSSLIDKSLSNYLCCLDSFLFISFNFCFSGVSEKIRGKPGWMIFHLEPKV